MSEKAKKNNGIYIIIAVFIAILLINLLSGDMQVKWADSIEWARSEAKVNNKPLFLLFTTKSGNDAAICDRMDYGTISKPDNTKYINKDFNPVKLEYSENAELARKYQVSKLPTIVLVLPDESHIRLEGFISEKEFYPRVSTALETLRKGK